MVIIGYAVLHRGSGRPAPTGPDSYAQPKLYKSAHSARSAMRRAKRLITGDWKVFPVYADFKPDPDFMRNPFS